ncbi:MAG: hypothetical protein OD815_001442, partial [Candidatus Alkanophagales archaeon MCA70_species_2]|nr:hypothetical protein [Candidatus Alkanophaga liquidiphilum]
RIKHDERNFVNTRIWQVAHEIVEIAMKYDAMIAIEKLKNLRKRNGEGKKPKKANRKIHRIPFHKFKQAIQSVAWQHGIDVVEVPPAARTSQRCPNADTLRRRTGFSSTERESCLNADVVMRRTWTGLQAET